MYIIFDTNVLLKNPALITEHKGSIVITPTILNELDFLKKDTKHGKNACLAINNIEKDDAIILKQINISEKIGNDNRILKEVLSQHKPNSILLVSDDAGMRLKAKNHEIESKSLLEFIEDISKSEKSSTEKNNIKEKQQLYKFLLERQFIQCNNSISNGIDFNFHLENGSTPLIESIKNKNFKAFDFIISCKNTDLDLSDNGKLKLTPFLCASQRRQIETMKKLINAGANHHITIKGRNSGNSALLIAAFDNSLNVVKFLLENKELEVSINQTDGNGFTALIKASFQGHIELVKYLLSMKADPFIRDKKDMSALDHAKENNNIQIISLIEEYIRSCKGKFNG